MFEFLDEIEDSGLSYGGTSLTEFDNEETTLQLKGAIFNVNDDNFTIDDFKKVLEDKNYKVPVDYKMYYFNNINGKKDIAFTAIDTNRFVNLKRVVYDRQWNRIENIYLNYPNDENASFEKPKLYEEMVEYAKILAKPFPHVRVDFYIINDKIFFGELSFTNEAGFGKIKPQSLNLQMGEWIKLPPKNV